MAVDGDKVQEFAPKKDKPPTDDEERKKKIVPGSLMKALMRPGGGDSRPSDGDQVIYHCTIRTLDGVVVESTRSEYGGKGTPIRNVLGKSKMILGLLEGIPTMEKGEVAMFKMKSQLHYGEDDCPVSASTDFPKDNELHFEIEMIDFFKARVVSDDLGVVKKIINEGQGWESPREPYEVKVWISAKAGNGNLILSHMEGEPYFFTFGKSEVPKGLEMGIGTMARAEKAVIYVTSQYLTPSSLIPVIEGFDEVYFEVELVHFIQVRDMLGDGRLIKRRIRDGKGEFPMDCPLHDSLLRVHYKGMLLNEPKRIFYDTRADNDDQPLEFSSGEGLVPEGFEMSVRLMLPGELSLVTCPPDYAYDKFPRPANVPEGAYVEWEIELLGFETPKDWTGMDFKSIMHEAEKIRLTGNRLFKEGKFELAKAKYDKFCMFGFVRPFGLQARWPVASTEDLRRPLEHVLELLREFNHVNPQDDDEGKEFGNTRNLLNLNVAACHLKLGECGKSIEMCNKVLDANPAHAKALYRRGMAYMAAGDFEEARSDFQMIIKVDKSSEADATAALLKLQQKEQEVERKARKQFKGLFDKKPGEIAEAGDREEDPNKGERQNHISKEDSDGDNSEVLQEDAAAADARQMGWFSRFWPTSRRIFSGLGLQRCNIL